MGKGTIISGGTDGQYSLTLNYADTRKDAMLAQIYARIDALEDEIETLTDQHAIARRQLWIAALRKRRDFLLDDSVCPTDRTITAWCADFTEDLTGEVGTVEINSMPDTVLIRPGYEGGAEYDSERDGQLQAMFAETPAASLLNWMFLDARQKWHPRHRTGTITAIDHDDDTCSVTLDAATGAIKGGDINLQATLTDVPIEYMNCDSKAFDEGDDVVVEFTGNSWDAPKVIGFKTNPKACDVYLQVSINSTVCSYTLGNKTVRIVQENPATEEMEVVGEALLVQTGDHGICGPFEGIDLTRPYYAELYYRSTNFYLGRQFYWYPYFEIGTASDYTFHLRTVLFDDGNSWLRNNQSKAHINFSNGDNYPMTTGDIVDSKSWYLKRVEWMRSSTGDLQSVATTPVATTGYGTLRVRQVNFNCKVLKWRHTGYGGDTQASYMACADNGGDFTIYDPVDCNGVWLDGDKWNYFAAFLGDERDGCWDRLGDLYHGLPDVGFSSINNILDFWTSGGLEWAVSGNWFLKYYGADVWSSLSTPPFIVADAQGTIQSVPSDDVLRVANIKQYSVGYCIDWDGINCIEYDFPCGDWMVIDDDERHMYTFQVVDLPNDFI